MRLEGELSSEPLRSPSVSRPGQGSRQRPLSLGWCGSAGGREALLGLWHTYRENSDMILTCDQELCGQCSQASDLEVYVEVLFAAFLLMKLVRYSVSRM